MKKSVTTAASFRNEWHFDDIPPGELGACYAYEYGREVVSQWLRFLRLLAIWKMRGELPKGHPDRWKGMQTFRLIHRFLSGRLSGFPPVSSEFFPGICWQDVNEKQRGEMAESFKDGWEQRKRELPQNRFSISTLRELKPANIDSLFAFAWVHELLADYDLSQTEYGFFAIDWNFDDPAIVGAFTDWLKVQRAERERLGADSPKYRKKGRGGFRDKLRWLGALRVIHHYSPDELADYADSNLKVDAPYSHLPDLYEAAKKAQTVVDAIRARKGPPPKPQWDSKALRKRVGIGDS